MIKVLDNKRISAISIVQGIECDKGYKPQIIARYMDNNLNSKGDAICSVDNIEHTLFLSYDDAKDALSK